MDLHINVLHFSVCHATEYMLSHTMNLCDSAVKWKLERGRQRNRIDTVVPIVLLKILVFKAFAVIH